jgi:rhodanese-related sulfurtransferase
MTTSVTAVPAADSIRALQHFEACLEYETDCWDVHESLRGGVADFILLDVRSSAAFDRGHIDGAVSQPHAAITEASMARYRKGTVFVVYCAGPHCNGAHGAAIRLASLERPVKMMIGGITGWIDEGFDLVAEPK